MAKSNEERLRETPPASGRLFNEAAEVVNIADLVSALFSTGAIATISGLGFTGDSAKIHIESSSVADSILDEYKAEIYNAASGNGPVVDNLTPYSKWLFQVTGITADSCAITIALDDTNFVAIGLKAIGLASDPVASIVADGIYTVATTNVAGALALPANAFKTLQVTRVGTTDTIIITALGRI